MWRLTRGALAGPHVHSRPDHPRTIPWLGPKTHHRQIGSLLQGKSPRFRKIRNVTKAQNAALPFLPRLLCAPRRRPASSGPNAPLTDLTPPLQSSEFQITWHPALPRCIPGSAPAPQVSARQLAWPFSECLIKTFGCSLLLRKTVVSAEMSSPPLSMKTFLSAHGDADAGPKGACPRSKVELSPQGQGLRWRGQRPHLPACLVLVPFSSVSSGEMEEKGLSQCSRHFSGGKYCYVRRILLQIFS